MNGTGPLHITSGQVIIGYHRNSSPYVNVPIDFGTATGFVEYPQNKNSYIYGALSGTGGVVFYQASTTTTGGALTLGGGSRHTWTGDTYILSQFAADANALPGRDRLGDLYVHGMLEVDEGTYNGLNGCGIIRRRSSGGGTISFGDNDADGDFTGRFAQNKGKFTIRKIGAGTQRLACSSMVGINGLQANAGTLILDGTLSESSVTVANGAAFGGDGEVVAGGVSFAEGSVFAVRIADGVAPCLEVAGEVIGSASVEVSAEGHVRDSLSACILRSGSAISATFTCATKGYRLEWRGGGTELWLHKNPSATVFMVK